MAGWYGVLQTVLSLEEYRVLRCNDVVGDAITARYGYFSHRPGQKEGCRSSFRRVGFRT